MKHGNSKRKFNRTKNQRNALIKSLARSLILKGKIQTTEAKAKSVKPFVEKLINRGKLNNLTNKRILISRIGKDGAKKIIDDLGPSYTKRIGGYTRIIKLPNRLSDGSKMAIIELVQ